MIPTPSLSHLTAHDYLHVYEPAEDTFALLDALELDAHELSALKPAIVLEIGSGSGCVSAFLGKIIGTNALFLCTDVNKHAAAATLRTGEHNLVPLSPIVTSLCDSLTPRLNHQVDILVFNPPYVPTDPEEALHAQGSRDIEGSWAGGLDGMEITNRLLEAAESLLSQAGRFYLVAIKENNIPEMCTRMESLHGLKGKIVLQRRAGREHLHVVRFSRSK